VTYYYGVNQGVGGDTATSSTSSSTSKDVEIVVNNTNVTDKETVLTSLEKLKNFITQSNYPL